MTLPVMTPVVASAIAAVGASATTDAGARAQRERARMARAMAPLRPSGRPDNVERRTKTSSALRNLGEQGAPYNLSAGCEQPAAEVWKSIVELPPTPCVEGPPRGG